MSAARVSDKRDRLEVLADLAEDLGLLSTEERLDALAEKIYVVAVTSPRRSTDDTAETLAKKSYKAAEAFLAERQRRKQK